MSIIESYNNICRYDISQPIQKLDLECNADAIKQEATQIIIDGQYGFKPLILTLPPGNTVWDEPHEDLQYAGVNACGEDYSEIKWNDRKCQTVYWSLINIGAELLCFENMCNI